MIFYYSGPEFHHAPEAILGKADVMVTYYDIDGRKVDPTTGVQSLPPRLQNYAQKKLDRKKRKKK
jgi:hypothetical protein